MKHRNCIIELALSLALVALAALPAGAKQVIPGAYIGPANLSDGDTAFEFAIGQEGSNFARCYGASTSLAPSAQNAIVTVTNPSASGVVLYLTKLVVSSSVAATMQLSNNEAAQSSPTSLTVLNLTAGGAAGHGTAASKLAGTLPTAAQSFGTVLLAAGVPFTLGAGDLGVLQANHIFTAGVGSITGTVTVTAQWCELGG